MNKLLSATLLFFFALPGLAQIKSAPVAGIYGAVPVAWAGALHSMGLVELLPTSDPDPADPVMRAGLAPVVMDLEAKGLTPATVSAADIKSAVAAAKAMVAVEARTLIKQVESAKPGQSDLPEVAARLNMLQGRLGMYLSATLRDSVQPAYEQAHIKLDEEQRYRFDRLLRNTAAALGDLTAAETLAAGNETLAGTVDDDSFARRHSRLGGPRPSSLSVHDNMPTPPEWDWETFPLDKDGNPSPEGYDLLSRAHHLRKDVRVAVLYYDSGDGKTKSFEGILLQTPRDKYYMFKSDDGRQLHVFNGAIKQMRVHQPLTEDERAFRNAHDGT